jgi:hypothetical protein
MYLDQQKKLSIWNDIQKPVSRSASQASSQARKSAQFGSASVVLNSQSSLLPDQA